MNALIYWNYGDSDSKKMYSFLDSSPFRELCQKENIDIRKEHKKFDNDGYWNQAEEKEMLLFFTHGEEDAILKFRYKQDHMRDEYVLATEKEINRMAGKRIVAICCQSAKGLGKACSYGENPVIYYIGFEGDIEYSDHVTASLRSDIYRIYSDVFGYTLYDAYENKRTAKAFIDRLKKGRLDEFTKFILFSSEGKNKKVSDAVFHKNTVRSLVVLGNADELLFP